MDDYRWAFCYEPGILPWLEQRNISAVDFRSTVDQSRDDMIGNAIIRTPSVRNSLAWILCFIESLETFNFFLEVRECDQGDCDTWCNIAKDWKLPLCNGLMLKVCRLLAPAEQRLVTNPLPSNSYIFPTGVEDSCASQILVHKRKITWDAVSRDAR